VEKSNFVDQIRVFCKSGHGGAGSKHFMRTKYNALAGPDGGDGGRGGHIILRGNKNTWTLLSLRYYKNVLAEDGEAGSGNNSSGRFGKDIYIDVPLGTIARDEVSGLIEGEILEDGQEIIWLKGGRGGQGNAKFATPTNQAPEHAQPGEDGVEGWKVLELKVLADVGLVGFPNAGKSTLLSVMTAATPKIADYAFTTLTPQLGMIPADSPDHRKEFEILRNELEQYNPELLDKRFVIAISKSDLLDEELIVEIRKELPADIPNIFISSATHKGIQALKDLLWSIMNEDVKK